ncbi:MAG TPA: LamG domain-containing protein [Acidobacteriaceae bacterium]|nr:LamG domain-containing protein [Acidobacteriaceae bacterium]
MAQWSFARGQGAAPKDSVRGVKGTLAGYYKYVSGASGDGLRFDGYTTSMTVSADNSAVLGEDGFTVEAWVALNTFPWNWVPIVDCEEQQQEGFFFGIDAFGHVGLQASIDGQWESVTSTATLPLKRWAHIVGAYETSQGHGFLKIYLNGMQVGRLVVKGKFTPADADFLVGRVRQPTMPFPEAAIHPKYPVWYSLDGILDEVAIYDRSLTDAEITNTFAAVKAPAGDVLPWPKMPSGPPGAGRFGAYYATLKYQDTWDRLRRVGLDSDVVVRFDESPNRLVFWQGTNFAPAWVTENDKWYSDEFLETWGSGCPLGADCEPMSDKQNRYAHVDILESDNARAVVHWRYALAEVEKYQGAWPDAQTGWFDWTDEYWTIYPDGVAVRKQVLHTTSTARPHEWQETIVLNQPGSKPDDDINWDAVTLENMQGETKTYTWHPKPAGSFVKPDGPAKVTGPPDPNIQIINLKSQWKPFQIVSPDGATADIYNGENTYFNFECWNHWPVAQIASSGRPCVASDRASHTSLSHLRWKAYSKDEDTETKILMSGLSTKSPAELLPLAKSWLAPPNMQVEGEDYSNNGYDSTQRAYVLTKEKPGAPVTLRLTLNGSDASPIFDPAIGIKGWGEGEAQLKLDGKAVTWGKRFRLGHIHRLESTDLVVWIETQSTNGLTVELAPR